MRVLLISVNREKSPYPVEPLGAAYVASSLRRSGHEVRILDLCFEQDGPGAALSAAASFRPGLIGISIRNIDNLTWPKSVFYLPEIKKVSDRLKASGVPVVLGGSGFSLFPEETLEYLEADFGIPGEGEEALVRLVSALETGEGLNGVPGLCMRKGRNGAASIPGGFQNITPARDLLDYGRYAEAGGMANIQTKRGCPFECVYCTYPLLEGRNLRLRDPGDVADEVERLYKDHGADYFFFVDDIFNVPQSHAVGISEEIIKRRLRIRWACFASPKNVSKDLFHAMKFAGCAGVEFGTDGGADETLEALGKGFSPYDVERAQTLCGKAGLEAAHYLILGGPGETPETLDKAFRLMERIRPRAVIAMLGVRVYPGTALSELSVKEGLVKRGASLLEPTFYISSDVKETLLDTVRAHAASSPNWVVPGLEIRSSDELAKTLALLGKRGVLWDLLGN